MHQPFLHELVTAVSAPGVALSATDGQVRGGAHGLFWADRRLLSRLVVRVDGREPEGLQALQVGAGAVRFLGVLRDVGDAGPDPTVTVQRDRVLVERGMVETIAVRSAARELVGITLELDVACDGADMAAVKAGASPSELAVQADGDGVRWDLPDGSRARLHCAPVPAHAELLSWPVVLEPGAEFVVTVRVQVENGPLPTVLSASRDLSPVTVRSDDRRLAGLFEQSIADLASLRLADPLEPDDVFYAAGAPWFLTLFGRDSIWAARMSLPLGTELAAGTLRALARRQGTEDDPRTAQQPGKIMHEIRPAATNADEAMDGFRLPPLYYGTVDATALWISLLHDARQWGLADDEVRALLPNLERAMGWLTTHAAGPNGFVSYRDASGRGLANQGWKDSGDSVQFADGSLATAPIALCEVQGYAYAAAHQAAALCDAFGRAGGDEWRRWADELATRFRDAFWVDDAAGSYPAIALDANDKRVDTVTSNIAHLLGTGMLDAGDEAAIVARLARPDMDSGYGLRTMSSTASGFNPLAYHGGSVWTHDTAIAVLGLASSSASSAADVAAGLTTGLLAAAPAFDFRLPELFGGHSRADFARPVPYPAACRPQAWSAAAAVAILTAALGLRPDAPNRMLRLRPMRPSPVGALEVRGLRFGGSSFDVRMDADGDPEVRGLPRDVRVIVD